MYSPEGLKAISRWREVTRITGTSRPDGAKAKKTPVTRDAHLHTVSLSTRFRFPALGASWCQSGDKVWLEIRASFQGNCLSEVRDRYPAVEGEGKRSRGQDPTDERDLRWMKWTGLDSLCRRSGGAICGRGTFVGPH